MQDASSLRQALDASISSLRRMLGSLPGLGSSGRAQAPSILYIACSSPAAAGCDQINMLQDAHALPRSKPCLQSM